MTISDWSSSDISDPSYRDLFHLASLRTWSAAYGNGDVLPKTFLNGEIINGKSITQEDQLRRGNFDSEEQRINFTISHFPERRLPAANMSTIGHLLGHSRVLQHWPSILPKLRVQARSLTANVVQAMHKNFRSPKRTKSDFLAVPVDIETEKVCTVTCDLWNRALTELSIQLLDGKDAHVLEFLGIYTYLRDPIGGLSRSLSRQATVFEALFKAFFALESPIHPSVEALKRAVAQAAQESALLSVTYLISVTHIRVHGHQQMSYAYIPLEHLARSEFSKPTHVLGIVGEILLSSPDAGLCPIVPITIATYPDIFTERASEELTIIIDGNHRATAVMLLRILARKPQALRQEAEAKAAVREYCEAKQLGKKWQLDLEDVLSILFSFDGQQYLDQINDMWPVVRRFTDVDKIPALVVQEESFHTVSAQRAPPSSDRPRLLQPVHQGIFNTSSLGFALPNAGQVHGRTAGFKLLPLIPVTQTKER